MGRSILNRGSGLLALLAVGALVGGVFGSLGRSEGLTPRLEDAVVPVSESRIDVHVAGWVVSPGVVAVDEGSIVADAVAAAGGLRAGALADRINLAAPLRAGDQVVVPGPAGSDEPVVDDGVVSLNRADVAAMQELPGVGPVLAERIVAYRDQNGPFQQVEDLLLVPGIGEAKLASIRDHVRVP